MKLGQLISTLQKLGEICGTDTETNCDTATLVGYYGSKYGNEYFAQVSAVRDWERQWKIELKVQP